MTNGIENIECRTGDLFKPVQGHAFDLIVTNPPFVISPERAYIYRDSGMDADDLCRTIVREAPRYLADGGFCQILCNWAEYAGSDWNAGLESWFAGTGCDAWVMRSECRDIATYASTWIRHTEKNDAVNYPERFGEWLRYYDHLGISHIGAGVITMRKRSASRNWFRADEAPDSMLGPCGDGIANGFLLQDFLDGATDRDLLGARLTLSPDARLERSCSPSPEGWMETALKLRLARGLAYSGDIDPFMAGVLTLCSGQRSLGEILQDLAAALDSSPDTIQGAFIGIIRALVGQGFLLPEGCRFEQ
jgi:hypothetical protein